MMRRLLCLSFLSLLGAAQPAPVRSFPVDVSVPVAPTAFRSDGKVQVVYELLVRSLRAGDLDWTRLEVLDDANNILASYSGAELEGLVSRPGSQAGVSQTHIPAGTSAIAYLWLTLAGPPPAHLHHRVVFVIPASSRRDDRVVEGGRTDVHTNPVVIGPPVHGAAWVARWNDNASFHRRGLLTTDGRAEIVQRFAIDWSRFGPDGREVHGEGKQNEDYAPYGQEVIAVADAVVARVTDGIPLNAPPNVNPAVPITIDTAAGNAIALKLANGLVATYAHLQPHSIRVKEGDRVRRGQTLALLGNSGNAIGPHLHFHIATGPMLEGQGMPYEIDRFDQLGVEAPDTADGAWTSGKFTSPVARRNEFPAQRMVVSFP